MLSSTEKKRLARILWEKAACKSRMVDDIVWESGRQRRQQAFNVCFWPIIVHCVMTGKIPFRCEYNENSVFHVHKLMIRHLGRNGVIFFLLFSKKKERRL